MLMQFKFTSLLVIQVLLPLTLHAHMEMPLDGGKILKEADAIVLAQFETRHQKKNGKCSTNYRLVFTPLQIIRGDIPPTPLLLEYDVYHPLKAKWFWQSDCPMVSYFIPPIPSPLNISDQVVVAVKKTKNSFEVTGVFKPRKNIRGYLEGNKVVFETHGLASSLDDFSYRSGRSEALLLTFSDGRLLEIKEEIFVPTLDGGKLVLTIASKLTEWTIVDVRKGLLIADKDVYLLPKFGKLD